MTKVEYTYAVLKYRHDPISGEVLNFGVLGFSPTLKLLRWRIDTSTKRFFHAFAKFNVREHQRTLSAFRDIAGILERNYEYGQLSLFEPSENKWTASSILGHVWPDKGVRYHFGSEGNGAAPIEGKQSPSAVFDRVMDSLFAKFVLDQRPGKADRPSRTDEDVWTAFKDRISDDRVILRLQPAKIRAAGFEFKFEHTFKNGKLHVVQPISFDLLDADAIRDKAMRWYGYGHALEEADTLGKLVLLVGGPSVKERQKAYAGALELLSGMGKKPTLIRESETIDIGDKLHRLLGDRK